MAPVLPSDFDGILPPPNLGVTVREAILFHDRALPLVLQLTHNFYFIATR